MRLTLCLSLAAVIFCAVYDLCFTGKRVAQEPQRIQSNIESLLEQTQNVGNQWLLGTGRQDQLLDELWRDPSPAEWRESGVSLYLAHNDTIVFWANNTFLDPRSEAMILGGGDGVISIDSAKVLVFKRQEGTKSAITVVELSNGSRAANLAIFSDRNTSVLVDCDQTLVGLEHFSVGGKNFCAQTPTYDCDNFLLYFIWWVGLFGCLVCLASFVFSLTSRRYVWRYVVLFTALLIVLRLALGYFDLLLAGKFSCFSINTVVTSVLLLFGYSYYIYVIRRRIAYRVTKLSRCRRWVVFGLFTLVSVAMVVYFHYAIVELISHSTVRTEIYNIFSMSWKWCEFYCACAIYACCRVLYNIFLVSVFPKISAKWRIALNLALLFIVLLPFASRLGNTIYIVCVCDTLFLIFSITWSRFKVSRIFVLEMMILSLYLTSMVSYLTSEAKFAEAKLRSIEWVAGNLEQELPFNDFAYSIISDRRVELKSGHKIDVELLMPLAECKTSQVVSENGYVHIVEPLGDKVLIMSYISVTWLDRLSFACYIFLGLYILSGLILRGSGVDVFNQLSSRTLEYRIRLIVMGVALVSMTVVALVVFQYSDQIYWARQRELFSSSTSRLIESFSKYCKDSLPAESAVSPELMLLDWYEAHGNAFNTPVTIYNTDGARVGGNRANCSLARIDPDAYRNLSHYDRPYFDKYTSNYSMAYISMFAGQQKAGYLKLANNEPSQSITRYWLWGRIFSVFVILLIMSMVLSLVLYSLVAGPIKLLTKSLGNIGALEKIKLKGHTRMDDEVGRLIVQYNTTIDYLHSSYEALGRSERESTWREMARQMAHEINNPLTPMRLKIQMLQRARSQGIEKVGEQLDSTLDVLIEQIDVLSNLTSDFSALARIEQDSMACLDISTILNNIVKLYDNNDKKLTVMFVNNSLSPIWVWANYISLSRLFVNVLQNASQAIEGEGMITVALSERCGLAVINFADSGHGVPPELTERIFEPNFTTRSGGSGLGLSMCRTIVESFRGTITVASEVGRGSVFTITLPVA